MPMKPLRALFTSAALAAACALGAGSTASAALPIATATPTTPVRVAVVLPLTVPATEGSFVGAEALATYTSPTGALTRELDQVIDTPVTLAIDPMLIASIRKLGTSAPDSAIAWLDRLALATNETFPLQYADADLTLALQAGEETVLGTKSLEFAIDPSLFAPASDNPTPAPTGIPEPDTNEAPTLPTSDSLLAWDYTMPDVAWPVADTVIKADLAKITASGFTSTILESTNVKQSNSASAAAVVGDTTAFVSSAPASALLRSAAEAVTGDEWVSAMDELEAALNGFGRTRTDASMVLTLDRELLITGERLDDTVQSLEASSASVIVPLSTIGETAPASATLNSRAQNSARVAATESMIAAEQRDIQFSTVAENPALITGDRRLALLESLSSSPSAHPGGFVESAATFVDDSRTLEGSVRLVKSSEIYLLADRTSIFASIQNDLDQPVTVRLSVRALSPLIRVENSSVEITVEPSSQKRAQVPVQSLSNGRVTVEAALSSPTNIAVGTPTLVRVNVQAGWEGPVTFVLGGLVIVIFALGLYRNLVLRRRPVKPSPELPRSE